MNSDAYEAARVRYRAAYDAYRACAQRVLEKLAGGFAPLADEIAEEARTTANLAAARRELLEAIAAVHPFRP